MGDRRGPDILLHGQDEGGLEKAINMAFSRRRFLAGLGACPMCAAAVGVTRAEGTHWSYSPELGRGRNLSGLLDRRRTIAD